LGQECAARRPTEFKAQWIVSAVWGGETAAVAVEFENFAALRMDLVDLLDSVDVVGAGVYANFV
jgi:hypothetical protein